VVERGLIGPHTQLVAGCDEVGRGALGGPVTVGVAVIDVTAVDEPPAGLADSKLLSARRRGELVPVIQAWVLSWGVGHATAGEIDEFGLIAALRRAGRRALGQLDPRPDIVLLDGHHDWLTAPPQGSWIHDDDDADPWHPPVMTRVKADRDCASVAAASVLAKVTRDLVMTDLAAAFPAFGWELNKGYGSPAHLEALARYGPCEHHRRSWRLPTVVEAPDGDHDVSVTSASTSGS
jgi:ribonuclease HII